MHCNKVAALVVSVLIAAALLYSQTAQQTQGTASVATKPEELSSVDGRVVNEVTGEPVKNAVVAFEQVQTGARAPASGYTVVTDAEGRYRAAQIQPGAYILTAQHAGFMAADYGGKAPRSPWMIAISSGYSGEQLKLTPGQEKRDVDFKLTPLGVIAGRVMGADGEPLPGVRLLLGKPSYSTAGRQVATYAPGRVDTTAITDDLGVYRMPRVQPGRYYVCAVNRQTAAEASGLDRSAKPRREGYVPTCYPGTADPAAASVVEATAGVVNEGINIKLAKATLTRVRGRVINQTGYAGGAIQVALRPANQGLLPDKSTDAGPQGEFELRDISPGQYILMADVRPPAGTYPMTTLPLKVGRDPIENVTLTVAPLVEIPGKVRTEAGESIDLGAMQIGLVTLATGNATGARPAVPGQDGSFLLRTIPLDHYDVDISRMPSGYYLKSARWGDRDVLDGMDVPPGGAGTLDLVLSKGAPSVRGVVRNDRGDPVSGATVVMIPQEAARRGNQRRYWSQKTSGDGSFTRTEVPPGEYSVYAWASVESNAWLDPEFMRPIEGVGIRVSTREGGSETVDLKAIPPQN